jgi:hypothetical protein
MYESDVPLELRNSGASFELYQLTVTCLIFLDDFAIPTISEEQTIAALEALDKHSDKWDIEFALYPNLVCCVGTSGVPRKHGNLEREPLKRNHKKNISP